MAAASTVGGTRHHSAARVVVTRVISEQRHGEERGGEVVMCVSTHVATGSRHPVAPCRFTLMLTPDEENH